MKKILIVFVLALIVNQAQSQLVYYKGEQMFLNDFEIKDLAMPFAPNQVQYLSQLGFPNAEVESYPEDPNDGEGIYQQDFVNVGDYKVDDYYLILIIKNEIYIDGFSSTHNQITLKLGDRVFNVGDSRNSFDQKMEKGYEEVNGKPNYLRVMTDAGYLYFLFKKAGGTLYKN